MHALAEVIPVFWCQKNTGLWCATEKYTTHNIHRLCDHGALFGEGETGFLAAHIQVFFFASYHTPTNGTTTPHLRTMGCPIFFHWCSQMPGTMLLFSPYHLFIIIDYPYFIYTCTHKTPFNSTLVYCLLNSLPLFRTLILWI